MEVTPTTGGGVTINDQQRDRISSFLSLEAQELSSIFSLLQDANPQAAGTALNKLLQQLDGKVIEVAGSENWKQQAEESKASLATEKINF
ncbi:hypothetical protein BGX23_005472, partial [Mortierella sp. AD031]